MFNRVIVCISALLLLLGGCAANQQPERRICRVHQIPMSNELVVLRNGASSWEYQDARQKYFPYSGTVYTGNILPSTQQQIEQTDICAECRRTEMKWFQGDFKEPEPEAAPAPVEEKKSAPEEKGPNVEGPAVTPEPYRLPAGGEKPKARPDQ